MLNMFRHSRRRRNSTVLTAWVKHFSVLVSDDMNLITLIHQIMDQRCMWSAERTVCSANRDKVSTNTTLANRIKTEPISSQSNRPWLPSIWYTACSGISSHLLPSAFDSCPFWACLVTWFNWWQSVTFRWQSVTPMAIRHTFLISRFNYHT